MTIVLMVGSAPCALTWGRMGEADEPSGLRMHCGTGRELLRIDVPHHLPRQVTAQLRLLVRRQYIVSGIEGGDTVGDFLPV